MVVGVQSEGRPGPHDAMGRRRRLAALRSEERGKNSFCSGFSPKQERKIVTAFDRQGWRWMNFNYVRCVDSLCTLHPQPSALILSILFPLPPMYFDQAVSLSQSISFRTMLSTTSPRSFHSADFL